MKYERSVSKVHPTITPDALIIRVEGDIESETTRSVLLEFREAAALLPPPALVVVDLLAVGIVSAAGLRLLRRFAESCHARGLTVHLVVAPDGMPLRVIELTGLNKTVLLFSTMDDALRAGAR